jgi:hypothetical protein
MHAAAAHLTTAVSLPIIIQLSREMGTLRPRGPNEEAVIYDEVSCLVRAYETAFSFASMRPAYHAGHQVVDYSVYLLCVLFQFMTLSLPCRAPFQAVLFTLKFLRLYLSFANFPVTLVDAT